MPSKYASRGGALQLPLHEDDSHPDRSPSPMWRRQSGSSRPAPFSHQRQPSTAWGRASQQGQAAWRRWEELYWGLKPAQRILLSVAGVLAIIATIVILIFGERIFRAFLPVAQRWRELKGGWVILWLITFLVAFPPMIGYSTCVTLAGVLYGIPNGWFVVSTATVAGSSASFLVSRTVLSGYVQRLVANNQRFTAFSHTLKRDGLKLLVMIRLCPLPYSLSNGAVATFPTVTLLQFALATAIVTPKLMIPVFVGTRLGAVWEHGDEMDAKTKIINVLSIVFGVSLGIFTGWFIHKQTQQRTAQIEREEADNAPNAAPSPTWDYSDDPERAPADDARDDISLRTNDDDRFATGLSDDDDAQEMRSDRYKDLMSDDDDDDVFRKGDGDTDDEGDLGRYRA